MFRQTGGIRVKDKSLLGDEERKRETGGEKERLRQRKRQKENVRIMLCAVGDKTVEGRKEAMRGGGWRKQRREEWREGRKEGKRKHA